MSKGTVVQVIGAVIDVEFSKEELPKIYDALVVEEADLILEVQQQLGDGVVRTIAMGTTEGLKRGAEAENTGEPVTVPVGEKTLGRILNVLGKPIDGKGEVGEKERMPIHRNPPSYEEHVLHKKEDFCELAFSLSRQLRLCHLLVCPTRLRFCLKFFHQLVQLRVRQYSLPQLLS